MRLAEIECLVGELFLARGERLLARRQLRGECLRRLTLDLVEQMGRVRETVLRHLRVARVVSTDRFRGPHLGQPELGPAHTPRPGFPAPRDAYRSSPARTATSLPRIGGEAGDPVAAVCAADVPGVVSDVVPDVAAPGVVSVDEPESGDCVRFFAARDIAARSKGRLCVV